MDSDSAITEEQYTRARIDNLQNQSAQIKSQLVSICQKINELNLLVQEKQITDKKSQSRRSLFLIVLLAIFIFVFIRYYSIISNY